MGSLPKRFFVKLPQRGGRGGGGGGYLKKYCWLLRIAPSVCQDKTCSCSLKAPCDCEPKLHLYQQCLHTLTCLLLLQLHTVLDLSPFDLGILEGVGCEAAIAKA